jgi:hypothetical protein
MNYDFDYKQLGTVTDTMVEKLLEFSKRFKFTPFQKWPITSSGPLDLNLIEIKDILNYLSDIADPSMCTRVHINTLLPMSYVFEHSDTDTDVHRLHIPLISNDRCSFMWSGRDNRMSSLCQMTVGGVYIMNEVANHSLINLSREPRIHFVLIYTSDAIKI